jgi:hypothetical protein
MMIWGRPDNKKQYAFMKENGLLKIEKGGNSAISSFSGGEENRTPVQTYSSKAFYMFIC